MNWRDAVPCDFAVLGDPIAHSLSPRMHQTAFAACGLNLTYRAIRVPLEEFDEALSHLAQLGVKGVNCTVPLKLAAREWCGSNLPSINTLRLGERSGISTDEDGFSQSLEGIEFAGKRAVVLGAGGSALALASRLIQDGWELRVWARRTEQWLNLRAEHRLDVEVVQSPDIDGADLILNATSASLRGESLPLDWSNAKAETVAYDLAYGPAWTPFLAEAASSGLRVQDGRRMLMEQGALSFEWWHNIPAPREDMLKALYEHSPADP